MDERQFAANTTTCRLASPECKFCGQECALALLPAGTVRDAHQAFFVGGSPELEDLEYLTTPAGFDGKLLSKYGFKTQTAGTIKVGMIFDRCQMMFCRIQHHRL